MRPKKKDPLMKPHHFSSTCNASLTNTYKIAAIQTVSAIVSRISMSAIFRNTGILNNVCQPALICSTLLSRSTFCSETFSNRYIEIRSEEHTSELQSRGHLVCRLLLEKKK